MFTGTRNLTHASYSQSPHANYLVYTSKRIIKIAVGMPIVLTKKKTHIVYINQRNFHTILLPTIFKYLSSFYVVGEWHL